MDRRNNRTDDRSGDSSTYYDACSQSSGSSQSRGYRPRRNGGTDIRRNDREDKGPIAKADLAYNAQTFVKRPDRVAQDMKIGRKTKIETNFVKMNMKVNNIPLFLYNVKIMSGRNMKVEVKRDKTARMFWECVRQNSDQFPETSGIIYNDVNMVWLSRQMERAEMNLPIYRENDDRPLAMVEFKYTGVQPLSTNTERKEDLNNLISLVDAISTMRTRCPFEIDSQSFHACDNVMFLVSQRARERDFSVPLSILLGDGLEAWIGLHMAVKINLMGGLMVNYDLCHSVFYKSGYSILRMLAEVIARHHVTEEEFEERFLMRLQTNGIPHSGRKRLEDLLKGKLIRCSYGTFSSAAFKFTSLTTKSARSIYFSRDGYEVSVAQHFMEKGYRLRFPELPCINGKKMKNGQTPVYPIEVCFLVNEPQKLKGKPAEAQLATIIRNTAYSPHDRREILYNLSQQDPDDHRETPALISSNDTWMQEYGIEFENDFVKVDATILPPPTLKYGNSEYHDCEHHGVWDAANNTGFRTALTPICPKTKKKKMIVASIITVQNPNEPQSDRFNCDLSKFSILMNVVESFGQPVHRDEQGSPFLLYSNTYHQNQGLPYLKKMLLEIKGFVDQNFQDENIKAIPLVLFIFSHRCTTIRNAAYMTKSDYGIIKKLCDCEIGLYAQGILGTTYSSFTTNINTCSSAHNMAFKILAKIGTVHYNIERGGYHKNWSLLTNKDAPTLVLGIDVTHPGDIARKHGGVHSMSVACVVGNVDLEISRFGESSRVQDSGQEQIVNMTMEITNRILEFQKNCSIRPAHIVVYRDGVSESQFKRVLYEEKNSIEQACRNLDAEYKPTITYIVVSKGHHTRFFPLSKEDMEGEAGNLKPGTLVEYGVTTKDFFDFYLISHFCPRGTAKPVHYYVLHDDWKPSGAFWQTITYALCYNYVRTTKSISIPSPVMYAHLAAKRAKDRLEAIDNIHLLETNRSIITNNGGYAMLEMLNQEMAMNEELDGMLFV